MTGPRILYILGLNRSGSTVYERFRGGADGVFAAGEVHNLFSPPFFSRTCACGEVLHDCVVWSDVLARVPKEAGMSLDEYVGRVAALHQRSGRTRHVARLVRGRGDASDFAALVAALYRAIAGATNASVVVDSSKAPAGAVLLRLTGLDFDVVHLARDPAATLRSNATGRDGGPPRISPLRLVGSSAAIAITERLLNPHVSRVRLETFLDEHAGAALPPSHQAEGNPSRFADATIRPDAAIASGGGGLYRRMASAAIGALRRLG